MLIEFKRGDTNSPVWVNPNHVVTVVPCAEDANCTVLRLVDGEQYGVRGEAKEIVKILAKSRRPDRESVRDRAAKATRREIPEIRFQPPLYDDELA